MFVDVGLGLKVGSVPTVRTVSSYEISGTDRLGAAGWGTAPAIGVLPSTDGAMPFVASILADCCVTCCYRGYNGDVGRTILMVSPFFLGFYTVSSIITRI